MERFQFGNFLKKTILRMSLFLALIHDNQYFYYSHVLNEYIQKYNMHIFQICRKD